MSLEKDPGPATIWLQASSPQERGPLYSEGPGTGSRTEIPLTRVDVEVTEGNQVRLALKYPDDRLPSDHKEGGCLDEDAWMTLIQFSRAGGEVKEVRS